MITDGILKFFALCVNGLVNLLPSYEFPQLDGAMDVLRSMLANVGYFLPLWAISIFFTGVLGYYIFEAGEYVIKLILKYVTRLL